MRANAEDNKIVAKLDKDKSLPFGVMEVCVKCAGVSYDVVLLFSEQIVNF